MFTQIFPDLFRWETQDPEYDWMMVGHLLRRDGELLIVDPPYIHGLEEAIKFVGNPQAIILTTADHTRGSRYLSNKLKLPIYVPIQDDSLSVSPDKQYASKRIVNYISYSEGSFFWLSARRVKVYMKPEDKVPYIDEMILMDNSRNMITGDIAMGSATGNLLTVDEGFTTKPRNSLVKASYETMISTLKDLEPMNLIAGHGYDLLGDLKKWY